ncbi:hypothetical protein C2E31_05830 [Rhodopirellula baltica]|nr:hypothetical protein C2E31_05830 [Rhodopirellula baltica]
MADTDTRFRSGHLQKLASIYLQVGEPDQSLAVGDELLASSGGSVESFRFYADLCGRLGKSDLRLDSLRRCVRMNPRSVDAQQMLAEQLAEDFKTDQAIELYWQILEGKDDLESQRKVVAQLANLYLRTNRLDQLVTRLEIRGREMSDRRTAVDLTATAYAEVGDVGLAKQTLEGLLQESGRDTMLMQRLVELSQQAGELDEALSLQRQLTQLSPDRNNEAMLATLLLDTGATKEAEAIWMKIAESENDSKQLRRNLNRLFDNGEPELAIKLVNQALKHDPRNWELLLDLTVFQATSDQWEDSAKTAERLISLDLPEETLPEGGKPYPTTQTYQGQTYPNPPIRYVRVNGLYPLLRLVDSRYGSSGNPTLPTPMDYGQAKVMAQYCKLHYQNQEGLPVETKVHELVQNALKENATSEEVWDAYQKQLLYATATQQNSMNYQNPSDWPLIWKVAEKVPASGDYALGVLLNTRSSNYKQRELQLQPLSQERLDWLKNRADNQHSAMATSLQHPLLNWHAFYVAELEIAQQDEAAKEYAKRLVEVTSQKIREENLQEYELLQAVELISLYGTDDQLWDAIETALRTEGSRPTNNAGNRLASLLSRFANPQRVSDGLSKGVANSNYRQRLFEISDTLIAQYADQPLRHRTISLTGTGGPRNSYQLINGNYRSIVIEFPPQGLGPDDEMIRVCHQVWESLDKEDAVDEWIAAIETSLTSSADSGKAEKPAKSVWQRVFLACVLQWDGQTSRASELIEEAIAIAQDATPQLDAELRLLSADLKLRAGQQTQALDTIDAISVYDRQTMAIREFAAAKLSAAIGNVERARVAARRLFGVRLSASAQIELAKLMSSLGMQDLATDLVRRMRSRGGSTPDELESVMRFYFSQQETELASEVAMELLRRNVNVSRNTRNRTTANAQRLSALQTLAKTGKLTALIEQTEQRLENAPQSTRIRVELAEMYEAIGQKQKSLALMSSADTDSVTSFTALIDTARQFAQAGNHDAACDAYLKAFRTNQSSFSNDFYEIIQPFEHQQRLSDLAEMMVEVGVQKFDRYRVSEVCNRLVRSESHLDDARKFFEAILDSIKSVPGQQSQSFDNLSGYLPRYLKSESTMRKLTETLIEYSKLDRGFTRLFSGYSTSQDGEHNNMVTTFTRFLQKNPEQLNYVIERVRQASEENDQWASGRLWLGMLYTADKQFDEANVLFDQAIASKGSDQLSYNGLWLVASYIDQFDPLKPTAERFYEHALTVPSNYRTSDFQYTLESRYCNFLKDNGNAEKARQIALSTLNSADSEPRIVGNNDYEAYRRISNTMSLMQFFKELGYPADGLRIARDLDRSLFDKASRYGSNASLENFEKVQSELIKQVQEQGGVDGLRSLIALKDDQKPAIDFLISQGTNPFTQDGLTSIWLDMARSATNKTEDEQTAKLTTFVEELHELAKERPDDQSLSTAIALIECMRGDLSVLRTQLNTWTGSGTDQTTGSQITKDQRNLLTLMASQILLKAKEQDQQLLMQAFEIALEGSANDDCFVLAELGKAFLQRGDLDAAQASWMRAVDRDVDQWLLLDLSTAAIEHEMAELSAAAFDAAIEAPKQTLGFDALSKGVSSLGELLGTASSSTSSAVSNASVTLNGADIRQAQQMMKLDEAWRKHNMPTSKIFDPYVRLVFPQAKEPHVLMVEHQAGQDQSVFVDSVLALLAQRAHDTNQSDVLLEHVSADTPQNNLIATLILLLDDQASLPRNGSAE